MESGDGFLFKVGLTVLLFVVGWYFGRRAESKHVKSLTHHEAALARISLSNQRFTHPPHEGQLVIGSVVVAQDYFKMTIAYIISFFGGRLTPYESLLERARREAIVRMKKDAALQGFDHIDGVRLEVTNIDELGNMVEALAYGTGSKR